MSHRTLAMHASAGQTTPACALNTGRDVLIINKKGGASLLRGAPALRLAPRAGANANRSPLLVAAFQTEAPVRTPKAAKAKPAAEKSSASTAYWPCRDGQMVRVVQEAAGGGAYTVRVEVDKLPAGQEAHLVW